MVASGAVPCSISATGKPRFPRDSSLTRYQSGSGTRDTSASSATLGDGLFGRRFQDDECATLTVLGRSTQPIKDLILEARALYLSREKTKTTVRRPTPKEHRQRGRQAWSKVAVRPSRSIDTVVLDPVQKNRLLADINEYPRPATPRWYANRGIPYRRGYFSTDRLGRGRHP